MARTSSDIVIDARPAAVMDVIADFAAYPEWATGVKSAQVVADGAGGRPSEVAFVLDASPIKDEYTLAYEWHGDRSVSWTLSRPGAVLTSMDGTYTLEPLDSGATKVTYQLRVDVAIPLLGMLKRKAEKVVIDSALKGLKRHIEATR
jgi:carbon monoxide dehydrogenase subunit G